MPVAVALAALTGAAVGRGVSALLAHLPPGVRPLRAAPRVLVPVTAVLWAAVVAAKGGDGAALALGLALVTLLVAVVPVDLEHRLILDVMTYPAAALALITGLALDPGGVPEQLVAALAAGGFLLAAGLARPGAMGLGDAKLAAVLGLCLGAAVAPAVLVALLAGTAAGGVAVARTGLAGARRATVAFGPFLGLGALVGLFAGGALVDAYLGSI